MNKNQTKSKLPSVEELADEGLDGTPCSVSLSHDQIAFLREALEKRRDKAINEPRHPVDKMWGAYLDEVVEVANKLLTIISPCASVKITPPNA
jgi:hypothetical protein